MVSILMLAMVFTFSTTVNAQESEDYTMWENIMLTPDFTNLKTLQANMRSHNQKYHKVAPYTATVYNISSGPNAGNIIWQMGPMMFKHNDGRPSDNGHDEDWRDKIMPYIKKMHSIEYWTQDDDKSIVEMLAGTEVKYPILFIRYFEVEEGHGYSLDNHFKQISETLKSIEGAHPWGLYYNDFQQGDLGRHVATVGFYKDWADFDAVRPSFVDAYEKLYGKNSWDTFLKARDHTFSNRWDEIWEYNKSMSGD